MARPADPGRTNLLDAGATVAERDGLRGLSVNAVVGAAGMAKGSFYHHFPDRRSFLVTLHRRYHDELANVVGAAIDGRPPGAERIRAGAIAFLDATLRSTGTKALLVQARTESDLFDEVEQRNAAFAALAAADLEAVGWPDPAAVARLFVAMVAEISLAELHEAGPRDDLRNAALDLVASVTAIT